MFVAQKVEGKTGVRVIVVDAQCCCALVLKMAEWSENVTILFARSRRDFCL